MNSQSYFGRRPGSSALQANHLGVNEDASPWPERRRTQYALFGTGGLLLAVVALALATPGAVPLGGAHVVGLATVAAALLIYGLLGWAGHWVDEDDAES
jgi:hypothetical protein